MAGLDSERAQKVARKLPAWAAVDADRRAAGLDSLEFPSALSLEQCSSSATALYKAGQAAAAAPPIPAIGVALDLTGGLGVDSWALAQVAERVVYFERNEELAAAAGRNFQRLGAGNIDVRCETVTPQTELPEADLIYADPARRDAAGRKVFLLEDCTPDILTLLPMLLRKAPAVLVKLSPMADLAMLAERFGSALREIHVVECDGEVKELLCLLLRDNDTPEPDIVIARLSGQAAFTSRSGQLPPETSCCAGPLPSDDGPLEGLATGAPENASIFGVVMPRVARFPAEVAANVQKESDLRFRISEEREAEAVYAAGVQPGDVLLEPCPALLKAGAFRLPCARWGLSKLAPSTHLYLAPALPGTKTAHFVPGNHFFKAWRVCDTLPFGAAAFKALKQRYPRADVTARNLPLGSAELQKRLGVASGGDVHIFGCRLVDGSSTLLVTEPL